MRRTLKAAEVEYKVVKNTLARIAAEGTPVGAAVEHITGPIGIAIGYDDPVIVAKKVQEYSKENEKFLIAGGVIEGRYLDPTLLKEVAKLPSRDVQLGMLAGAMSAPLTKMASLLKATIQNFGYALSALKEKKEQ
jgi:large subunit ribosomal protein L10